MFFRGVEHGLDVDVRPERWRLHGFARQRQLVEDLAALEIGQTSGVLPVELQDVEHVMEGVRGLTTDRSTGVGDWSGVLLELMMVTVGILDQSKMRQRPQVTLCAPRVVADRPNGDNMKEPFVATA